ncbi:MAG: NAD(P)-dependent oxidoreductase [Candidatus Omnitrophica bacterium]|nr:NAD(P)-dependent oxidoreductase [Candidatus Omnitrophota bacterium]
MTECVVLVTGATGFIGKSLVRRLLSRKKYKIVCLVRKTSNVDFLIEKKVETVVGDICDFAGLEKVFKEVRPDMVIHAAAKVSDTVETELHNCNSVGTHNICELCFVYEIEKLVYLSSVAVLSGNPDVPLTECLPYKASNHYGKSKIEAEQIVLSYREKGLPVSILRPCMVYGEDEPHALDRILRLVEKRRIPILNVPGMDSKLHLVYVENVTDALILALEKEEALTGTFMIADKEIITLRKFLKIIYDALEKGTPPVVPRWIAKCLMIFPPFRLRLQRIFKDRVYDTSRAARELGYDPGVSTEEGLCRTVRYWKETEYVKN